MSDNYLTIPKEIGDDIRQGMEAGGAIQLPFEAPFLYVTNGEQKMQKFGGVSYFGGWATDKAQLDDIIHSTGNTLPKYFTEEELTSRDGKSLPSYTARFVVAAPIAYRQSWVSGRNRYPDYLSGARRHVQILAYLADTWIEETDKKKSRKYEPWGPVVLTAKGYQAKNILDGFSAWAHLTKDARRIVAPDVPPYFFYASLGTFGDVPKYERVGQGDKQSIITPIELYAPATIDEALMRRLFVGDIYAIMADCKAQAKEWLTAWHEQSLDMIDNKSSGGTEKSNEPSINENIPF